MKGKAKKDEAFLLFGRLARKHRFVLPDDLEECLIIQQKLKLMGGRKRLGEVLIDQGYLTDEHVLWVLKRQRGGGETYPTETTLFGDLAAVNGFIRPMAVEKALKVQRKESKRGESLRVGELLVARGEMTPPERDAVLALQERLRGAGPVLEAEEGSARVLLLEEESVRRRQWRPIAAALLVGILLAALAAVVAFAILR
ncbi:MAG: hypothetical protein ACYTFG_14090 [Planctomycetota bacterium]|jgi:hypothetical protein